MPSAQADPGSFRDPGGQVYIFDEQVYRTVNQPAVDDFDYVESTGLIDDLVKADWIVPARRVSPDVIGEHATNACYVLEHPKLPFISYPYEWCFPALKAAALLHLLGGAGTRCDAVGCVGV